LATDVIEKLALARLLVEKREYDDAWAIVDKILVEDPNNVPALTMGVSIQDKARHLAIAYQMAKRCVDLAPNLSSSWTNFGRLCEELYQLDEAEKAYIKAISLSTKPQFKALNLNNLSSLYATTGRWAKAEEFALKSLDLEPNNGKARGNLGIAQLGQRKWVPGWDNYGSIIGSEYRKLVKYRDEPDWDGTPGKTVVVYGEQGLGDELSFASMIPDAIKVCKKVLLDCDHRLEGLFKRSFPQAKVYGTRWKREIEWDEEDKNPDYSISIGQLGSFFRKKNEDFPGSPYLVPERERWLMWTEYLKAKQKPIIGIAWSGGLQWTAERFRKWKLEELQPIFDSVDAHWVSLQYKDSEEEIRNFNGAKIHSYPFATYSKDYDDTAGLVSACDLVITMQTSVAHLSAALGIETWTFVNQYAPQWRYGEGEDCPWYKSMKIYRQKNGKWPIDEAARVLKLRYSIQKAA
jgi:tetratricopeptide (TPR) repeat protein